MLTFLLYSQEYIFKDSCQREGHSAFWMKEGEGISQRINMSNSQTTGGKSGVG